jgi:hypothetical protein
MVLECNFAVAGNVDSDISCLLFQAELTYLLKEGIAMSETRTVVWLVLVLMTVTPVFTALKDGSFSVNGRKRNGRQRLEFPMSYHYEALYGDIFIINAANYLILQILPPLPVLYHTGLYAICFVGSWYLHRSWAPRLFEKPLSHFFKEPRFPANWWKRLSPAGWLHLFFMPAALVLALEYTFFARQLPTQTVLTIGYLYLVYCLIAVMGYHTAISRAKLELGYDKVKELTARFATVAIVTLVKLP